MRYYKDDACTFSIIVSAGSNSKYVELKELLPKRNLFSTVKEAYKAAVESKEIHSIVDGKSKDEAQLYIVMLVKPTVDRTGDKANILRYCKNALFYFDNKFKFISAVLEMANDDGKIINATYQDGVLNYDAAQLKVYQAVDDDNEYSDLDVIDTDEVEADTELTRFLKSEAEYVTY